MFATEEHNSDRTWEIGFDMLDIKEVLTGEITQPEKTSPNWEAWNTTYKLLRGYLVSAVDWSLRNMITSQPVAKDAWANIKARLLFDRETPATTLSLLRNIVDLKLGNENVADHLTKFTNAWDRLQQRSLSSSSGVAKAFRDVSLSDEVKGAFLLLSLPKSMNNTIDNLVTKNLIKYQDIQPKLLDLSADRNVTESENKAYLSSNQEPIECSWCKVKKFNYKGHTYNNCFKLKKHKGQQKEANKRKNATKNENAQRFSVSDDELSDRALMANSSSTSQKEWILDTGATAHMTGCVDDLESLTLVQNTNVKIADNGYTPVTGKGTIRLRALTSDGRLRPISLQNVLLVPSFGQTRLFSWEQVRKMGYELFSKEGNEAHFSSYREFHEALGYPGVSIVKTHSKLYTNGDNIPPTPQNFYCSTCEKAKSKHVLPDSIYEDPGSAFEIIHSDLSGKFSVPSLSGKNYYITFIDGKTRFFWVTFLRNKDDASQAIIDFAKLVHRQFDTKIKRWRTDNGGEFVNKTVNSFFKSEGILHELTPPYEHERNRIAERFNQTLTTIARIMLIDLSLNLWAEAISTACYLKNRLPHSRLESNITPYEALKGKNPTIDHLQPFGRKCFVHIHKDSRPSGSKLLPRANEGKFVGYTESNKIFRIWIPSKNKVVESPNVKFVPLDSGEEFHLINSTNESNFETKSESTSFHTKLLPQPSSSSKVKSLPSIDTASSPSLIGSLNNHDLLVSSPIQHQPSQPETSERRHDENLSINTRPKRSTKPIERFGSPIYHGPNIRTREEHDSEKGRLALAEKTQKEVEYHAMALAARTASENNKEPQSIEEAFQQTDEVQWREAVNKELKSLAQNYTWDVIDRPSDRNIIGSKWGFKIKRNADGSIERYKARLVAQGFSQIPGHDFDETFAPVARYDSLRILLRISALNKWIPQQMDVNSAYLYGTPEEEIFMELPPGYRTPGKCAKLRKCSYGLKQSGREWYECISNSLKAKGFETTTFDPCVFVHPTEIVFISIYVDDILIFGPDNDFRQHLKTSIGNDFDCKDLGDAKYILGLKIIIHSSGIRISQQGYSKKILKRFGFTNAHKVGTPLNPNVTLFKGTEEERLENVKEYQAIVGSLMYLVIGSRPDLAYTVTLLS
ncbi:hypothetical protein K3495_g3097 [Podosphaera aphanis]|nr:hypothetical protein K3495_g3097 [Podosphaera aphanis]